MTQLKRLLPFEFFLQYFQVKIFIKEEQKEENKLLSQPGNLLVFCYTMQNKFRDSTDPFVLHKLLSWRRHRAGNSCSEFLESCTGFFSFSSFPVDSTDILPTTVQKGGQSSLL